MSDTFSHIQEFMERGLATSGGTFKCADPHLSYVGDDHVGGSSTLYIGRRLTPQEFQSFQESSQFIGRHAAAQQLIEITQKNFNSYIEFMQLVEKEYEQDH